LRVSVDGIEFFGGDFDGPQFHYTIAPNFLQSQQVFVPNIVGRDTAGTVDINAFSFNTVAPLADGYPLCRFNFSESTTSRLTSGVVVSD
jgi:hypothetical protein